MLILSRRKDQAIRLTGLNGETVEVVVVDVRGDRVRLGFRAGRGVQITRDDCKDKTPKLRRTHE